MTDCREMTLRELLEPIRERTDRYGPERRVQAILKRITRNFRYEFARSRDFAGRSPMTKAELVRMLGD